MAAGLSSNDRSLDASQKLLRLQLGQTQIREIVETIRPVGAPAPGIIPGRNQPQNPSHSRSPSRQLTRSIVTPAASSPHSLDTPPTTPR